MDVEVATRERGSEGSLEEAAGTCAGGQVNAVLSPDT